MLCNFCFKRLYSWLLWFEKNTHCSQFNALHCNPMKTQSNHNKFVLKRHFCVSENDDWFVCANWQFPDSITLELKTILTHHSKWIERIRWWFVFYSKTRIPHMIIIITFRVALLTAGAHTCILRALDGLIFKGTRLELVQVGNACCLLQYWRCPHRFGTLFMSDSTLACNITIPPYILITLIVLNRSNNRPKFLTLLYHSAPSAHSLP